MESIKDILMRRDGMSEEEAKAEIFDTKEELNELLELGNITEAEEICMTRFGLEPDYLMELL